jgi:hypothetical protein
MSSCDIVLQGFRLVKFPERRIVCLFLRSSFLDFLEISFPIVLVLIRNKPFSCYA